MPVSSSTKTLAVALFVQEPDATVGPNSRLPDVARLRRQLREIAAGDVVPVQVAPALEEVDEQQRRSVGPPVRGGDGSTEVDREVHPVAGEEVPDPRPLVAIALVGERQTGVAGDGRPAPRSERQLFVAKIADRLAGAGIEHTQRGVDEIAVLGVLETEKCAVGGQRTPDEASVGAAEPDELLRAMDLARRFPDDRDVDREAAAVRDRCGHDARCLGHTGAPAVRDAFEEGPCLTAVEGLHEPLPRLVARLVLEPEDTVAVERRHRVGEPDGVVRHLPGGSGVHVECVDLPAARLVRRVHRVPRRRRRPLRQERDRRAKALLPSGRGHVGEATKRVA